MNGFAGFPALPYGGFQIIEVPLYRVEVQARRHKRKSSRRWQKKWLKRFGTVAEFRRTMLPGQMIVDQRRSIIYAHPEEVRAIRAQFV